MTVYSAGPRASETARVLPHNVEMEQGVLGAILLNNAVMEIVQGVLTVEDFSEEIHRQIFDVAQKLIAAGQAVTTVTLKTFLSDQELVPGITLPQYVARLLTESSSPLHARDYAVGIHDLAVRRKIIEVAEEVANQAYDLPVSVRPAQMAGEAIASLHVLASDDRARSTRFEAHAGATETIEHIHRIVAGEMKPSLVTTGFADLDSATEGYQPGNLWVIGARPGQGKTIFFVTSGSKTARRGHGVKGFSLEVPKPQMIARVLADLSYTHRQPLTFQHIMRGQLAPDEIWRLEESRDRLATMPLVIDVASRLTPADIRIRVRSERDRMAARGVELKVIFIDYLKQIQASDRYKGNRVYEVGEISYSLKQLAKDEGICVVLLAQLNRALEGREDKRPTLSDLRESGDLEADADVVAFIHREAFYIEKSPEFRAHDPEVVARFHELKNTAELILGKNRAGPTCTVNLWCDVSCSTMGNKAREESL